MVTTSVILAAGQGTRMKSSLPKVLHTLLGVPIIDYALEAAAAVSNEPPVVVVGAESELIRERIGERGRFVTQETQLGTGHAVLQAEDLLKGKSDQILVTYADMPLLSAETLIRLVNEQSKKNGPFTMLTMVSEDSRGFGRILRDRHGKITAIVEEVQATPEQLLIKELNVGAYCFNAEWLWESLKKIPLSPKGEYYLTDLVDIAVKDNLPVTSVQLENPEEAVGINNRIHLAEADGILRSKVNRQWMLAGVTIVDPGRTYIERNVNIGSDTTLLPDTYLLGESVVGSECIVGPNSLVRDSIVGDNCRIYASVVEGAYVEDEVSIGPFSHLRKGARLSRGVHIGNFGEVKNSTLGPDTKMGHFSYIGDATIGEKVNIGAGTITCNFDGVRKNLTEIEDDVFIGSDTMLVAPVKIKKGSRTGAGSVVTKDVPQKTVVAGVPARAIRKVEEDD
ncbi:MAG: bifunctional UDP-N-acetylglucosamine diphosphorylase/glucosamine-1-phosphate N-acetyltransferase GlmU [Anaerolineales bacterium]|jgi:bifunctional UDP-N-acetylglucosamine pyrophosphorylase/glucosamine-1-phosphate N-acetyltransferase